ncbi:DUF6503 family protein [Aequorivita echinoideorum]|uniref:Deoxyribose-phosphate aldolase n=1 Tax=Aequorivita echinoideorum TaxID=1549647 RepID=A0ABS5S8T8_9FLAO|nr:DUF6503 family protein [Aequorivita echinoideorum]MBT0608290.1 deoxyribose-phosphate aldolase [Aequorivita echinoideorum]
MQSLKAIILLLLFVSCDQKEENLTAQQIVDKAIENAGGNIYENATINFTFRDTQYSSLRKNGNFEYRRVAKDSIGEITDVLTNNGFERFVNNQKINLADTTAAKYANSLNSVNYFVQLPFGLNDPAVQKELIGTAEINKEKYYEIEVTFKAEGGGKDHEDIYMYWIHQKNFTVDYLAYKFYTNEGGIRFREAFNERTNNGIRFVDYKNYKLEPWKNVPLQQLDSLFTAGKLELLSEIKTENISVTVSQ